MKLIEVAADRRCWEDAKSRAFLLFVEDFVLAHAKYDPSDWYGMDWDGYVGVKLKGLLDEITSNVGKELASKLAPHFTAMYYNNNARAMQVLRDKAT